MRGGSGYLDPQHQDALRLHADLHVGRLAADHEVGPQALVDHHLGGVLAGLRALLVGHDDQLHLDAVEALGEVGDAEHHGRERRLHVVRAAAVQAAALDPGHELLRMAGHHVQVPVEDEPNRTRSDLRHQTPPAARLDG